MVLIPPGTPTYYAIRFSPHERESLSIVARFFYEIDHIQAQATEPHVIKMKLQWWQEEIEKTFKGKPQHPFMQDLYGLVQRIHLKQEYFQTYLATVIADLDTPYIQSKTDLFSFCQHIRGSEFALYCQVINQGSSKFEAFAMDLGTMFECIKRINQFGQDLTRGRIYCPHQDLGQFQLSPAELLQKNCTLEQYQPLLQRQAEYAQEFYQKALLHLNAKEQYFHSSLLILAQFQLQLLTEIAHENYNLIHKSYHLTALRMCWIAWRMLAKLKKNSRRS